MRMNGKAAVGRMITRVMSAGIVGAALMAGGCDRAPSAPVEQPAHQEHGPTTSSATAVITRATTAPATRDAGVDESSVMEIGGAPYFFPPARLRVDVKDEQVRARLYSNDPPTALSKSYSGNFYYFDVPLDIKDPADIAEAQWTFKATGKEQEDSPNGIFLDGMKKQLQPYDATITFTRTGDKIMTRVTGKFLLFGEDQSEAKTVNVDGVLTAVVQGK